MAKPWLTLTFGEVCARTIAGALPSANPEPAPPANTPRRLIRHALPRASLLSLLYSATELGRTMAAGLLLVSFGL
jgi:hypothetical protein